MQENRRFPTRSYTNRPVESQKKARSLKFQIKMKRDCTICVAKTKALNQLCSYCEADLHLCFRIVKNQFFSRCGSFVPRENFN